MSEWCGSIWKPHRAFSIAFASLVPSAKYLHQDTSFFWWWPCPCGDYWVRLLRPLHKNGTNFSLKCRTLFLCLGSRDSWIGTPLNACSLTSRQLCYHGLPSAQVWGLGLVSPLYWFTFSLMSSVYMFITSLKAPSPNTVTLSSPGVGTSRFNFGGDPVWFVKESRI